MLRIETHWVWVVDYGKIFNLFLIENDVAFYRASAWMQNVLGYLDLSQRASFLMHVLRLLERHAKGMLYCTSCDPTLKFQFCPINIEAVSFLCRGQGSSAGRPWLLHWPADENETANGNFRKCWIGVSHKWRHNGVASTLPQYFFEWAIVGILFINFAPLKEPSSNFFAHFCNILCSGRRDFHLGWSNIV